jgi:hypothetical protein
MNRKQRRDEKYAFNRKPPKYKVGDLVLSGKGIIIKIHEKADYNKPFYLIHDVLSGKEEWIAENLIE